MTYRDVMTELKAMGTAQNRKIYKRHGAPDELFGVSFANLNKLRKQIKQDHELALKLWATGNVDARTLATMVADPDRMTARDLDAWIKDVDYPMLVDVFVANVVSRSPHAEKTMTRWLRSRREWTGQAGWDLVAQTALRDGERPDSYFVPYLKRIEADLCKAPNRVKHAMNNALISIGLRSPALEKKVVAAARKIGKVEVDHGATGCKTPDAIAYIQKAKAHKRKRTHTC